MPVSEKQNMTLTLQRAEIFLLLKTNKLKKQRSYFFLSKCCTKQIILITIILYQEISEKKFLHLQICRS